jgi:hypothetical protein
MNLPCPECSLSIALSMNGDSTYIWCCECGYILDTGISIGYNLKQFSRRIGFKLDDPAWAGRRDKLEGFNDIEPIQVYMPQHLYAFVQIRWPGWCLNCYDLCIKPYLSSIEAIEYVTKAAAPSVWCVANSRRWSDV